MSKSFRLRLLTYNVWHGLDHTRPLLMLPAENFLQKRRRLTAFEKAIQRVARSDGTNHEIKSDQTLLDLFCFQEVNPVERRSQQLEKMLQMESVSFDINVGLRLGNLSYPPFLQEGLSTLWRGDLSKISTEKKILSGSTLFEGQLPILKKNYTLHLGERRGALIFRGEWLGLKIVVVNLHLHHGTPVNGESKRRNDEIQALLQTLKPDLKADALFLLGDFNSELKDPELQALAAEGFVDLTRVGHEKMVTWDPDTNALTRKNVDLNIDEASRAWDSQQHQFDHILFKANSAVWKNCVITPTRLFDEAVDENGKAHKLEEKGIWLSDHFGLKVEISGEL